MKKLNIILIICLISIMSCTTVKNSSSYIITNKSYRGILDGMRHEYFKKTYCNGQIAVSWGVIDGVNNFGPVYFKLESKKYVFVVDRKYYETDINKIIPINLAQEDALKMAREAGFNSFSEFQKFTQQQRILEAEERKQQAEEKKRQEDKNKFLAQTKYRAFDLAGPYGPDVSLIAVALAIATAETKYLVEIDGKGYPQNPEMTKEGFDALYKLALDIQRDLDKGISENTIMNNLYRSLPSKRISYTWDEDWRDTLPLFYRDAIVFFENRWDRTGKKKK